MMTNENKPAEGLRSSPASPLEQPHCENCGAVGVELQELICRSCWEHDADGPAFHWRDGVYFQRLNLGAVLMTLPGVWKMIPENEWASIVQHVGRAEVSSPARPPQWQPIDTAPKDADVLLLWAEGWGVQPGYWCRLDEDESEHGWIASETEGLTGGRFKEATHWMPLPAAPGLAEVSSAPPQPIFNQHTITPAMEEALRENWRAAGIAASAPPPAPEQLRARIAAFNRKRSGNSPSDLLR